MCEHAVIYINGICKHCREQVKPDNFFTAQRRAITKEIHSANRMKFDAEVCIRTANRELSEIDSVLQNYPQKAR